MVAPYPEEESAEWSAPLLAFLEEQFAVLQSNIDHVPESGGDMLGANNGSDFAAPAVVRDNLGLGTAATADIGTDVGQVAAADDPLILGAVQASNNGADFADFVAFRAILDLLSSEEIEALVAGGSLTDATFAGIVTAATFIVTGLPGATGTSRYVGATASGHPVSGTFAVGDWVIDLSTGSIMVCTVAGSPGTWTVPSSGGGSWGSISGTLASQTDLSSALATNATAISTETSRATAAEGTNATAITAEATSRAAADTTNANAISAEATTRATADTTNASAITSEATSRAAADATNATAISAETTRATAAEAALATAPNAANAVMIQLYR